MKAIVYQKYGSPDVLSLQEVETPFPKAHEVLVKVHAASVNSWDWDLLTGKPLVYRLLFGLWKPVYKIIGSDIAGKVVAIGPDVNDFQLGDEVFGDISGNGFGAFAEFVCAPRQVLAKKSPFLTFEAAAAVPQAGVLALQALRYNGVMVPGQKILIIGAGGGVGTFAIQLAKWYGAEVTGVDSADKLPMLRSLGADHVIDYKKESLAKHNEAYDLILDVVGTESIFMYERLLRPKGSYVMVGGPIGRIFQTLVVGGLISRIKDKKMGLLMHHPNRADLKTMMQLVEAGTVVPVIAKHYTLASIPEALRYFGEGKAQGKIVVKMVEPNTFCQTK